MPIYERFEGFPVIISDIDGRPITKAIITAHDSTDQTITVAGEVRALEPDTRLQLLIIHSGGASEYQGIVDSRLIGIGRRSRDIRLYNGRQRTGRAATRHEINARGVIKSVVIAAIKRPLPIPLPVLVKNISKTGLLITSPAGHFNLGSVLEVIINRDEMDALFLCKVVREMHIDEMTSNFGCSFVSHPA